MKVHERPLSKILFGYLKLKETAYAGGWYCNGKSICGCRGNRDYGSADLNEVRYHCTAENCYFDYCIPCYDYYGNDHEHPLEKMSQKQV